MDTVLRERLATLSPERRAELLARLRSRETSREGDGESAPVTALPPSDVGAVQVTVALLSAGTAAADAGAVGFVAGTTAPVLAAADVPAAFCARTVNVYDVPLVRPVTDALRAFGPSDSVWPPGLAVTV